MKIKTKKIKTKTGMNMETKMNTENMNTDKQKCPDSDMKKEFKLKIKRQPTEAEIQYVIDRIWRIWIDYESLGEHSDIFYKDAALAMFGELSIHHVTSGYICDTIEDLDFSIPYETYEYMKKKQII
jgi:hypothetical protein